MSAGAAVHHLDGRARVRDSPSSLEGGLIGLQRGHIPNYYRILGTENCTNYGVRRVIVFGSRPPVSSLSQPAR